MAVLHFSDSLPDAPARRRAMLDHEATLMVEAGAGSGKTALMAGRIALMLAGNVPARQIVAITFTEAAASELLDRITRFVDELKRGKIPVDLRVALPDGLSSEQARAIAFAADTIDELSCTTIHCFCQQLVTPYPVEAEIDPGAVIIDPPAADLAYQDLLQAWLSARFGRDRAAEGLGRLPPLPALGEEDFFAELLLDDPNTVVNLILGAAKFLKSRRTASARPADMAPAILDDLSRAIAAFADWYTGCGVPEASTAQIIIELQCLKTILDEAITEPMTGRRLAHLLLHEIPDCRHGTEPRFVTWNHKGRWEKASINAGFAKARGGQLSTAARGYYEQCSACYQSFVMAVCAAAFSRFVGEFDTLAKLYADYKRQAALLDFDDLLHHARDLLARNDTVRLALSARYPRILVDEFQDTDPLQAEILWRLCGEGAPEVPWISRGLRPGSLFLVGDPKQAIYRFRGADVDTYLESKRALLTLAKDSVIEITANFRSTKPILDFVNDRFRVLLTQEQGQPGFTALQWTRLAQDGQPAVACFEIALEARHKDTRGNLVVDRVRAEEASVVARILQRLIGFYQVRDRGTKELRVCRAGDIALLAPTGTNLWIYERALEQCGISIASQAGKGFFRRQEVQDLIAVARAIADRHDTLGLGALLRGPLVGLTEEAIADAILSLPTVPDSPPPKLHLWTDLQAIKNPVLSRALEVIQTLARKARQTTPYQLMAEAVEELNVRPTLRARYRGGAERALANVELFLEMARAYDARGLTAFVAALRANWKDSEKQIEGRPDADAEAVSIITIHSAKGLEWPIVIPINSPTDLDEQLAFLHCRADDSVHFKLLGDASPDYESVKNDERTQLRHERIRLWYVALTRGCDLLLLPRQSERTESDWFSLLNANLDALPTFDSDPHSGESAQPPADTENPQDMETWLAEAANISAARRVIAWRSPSRHETTAGEQSIATVDEIYTDTSGPEETPRAASDPALLVCTAQGGRERGLVLHKLIEEVLNAETAENPQALETRAKTLLAQLDIAEAGCADEGPHAPELAATTLRALAIPEVAALRPRLLPEVTVFSRDALGDRFTYISGVADAVALNGDGTLDVVIDWKSDVDPDASQVELYRQQVRDYLAATGAKEALLVFISIGRIERVSHPLSVVSGQDNR
jgi:ATP-dependent exoDNAse (exonuclease V) beta subunit